MLSYDTCLSCSFLIQISYDLFHIFLITVLWYNFIALSAEQDKQNSLFKCGDIILKCSNVFFLHFVIISLTHSFSYCGALSKFLVALYTQISPKHIIYIVSKNSKPNAWVYAFYFAFGRH